jgi:hypothetical protein
VFSTCSHVGDVSFSSSSVSSSEDDDFCGFEDED